MRINLSENNRPDCIVASVRNSESTNTISRGQPVVLNLSTTAQPTTGSDGHAAGYEDGLQVVLPSTAGATASALFFYGVAMGTMNPNQLGEVMIFGVCPYALVLTGTRSASNATWASSASSSSGAYALSLDTVNNVFNSFVPSNFGASWSGTSLSGSTGFAAGAAQFFSALMLDSIASQASSTSNTVTTVTQTSQGFRVFVRAM